MLQLPDYPFTCGRLSIIAVRPYTCESCSDAIREQREPPFSSCHAFPYLFAQAARDEANTLASEGASLRASEKDALLQGERAEEALRNAIRDRDAVVRHMEEAKASARQAKQEAGELATVLEGACVAVSSVWAELSQASKSGEEVVAKMRGAGAVTDIRGMPSAIPGRETGMAVFRNLVDSTSSLLQMLT